MTCALAICLRRSGLGFFLGQLHLQPLWMSVLALTFLRITVDLVQLVQGREAPRGSGCCLSLLGGWSWKRQTTGENQLGENTVIFCISAPLEATGEREGHVSHQTGPCRHRQCSAGHPSLSSEVPWWTKRSWGLRSNLGLVRSITTDKLTNNRNLYRVLMNKFNYCLRPVSATHHTVNGQKLSSRRTPLALCWGWPTVDAGNGM